MVHNKACASITPMVIVAYAISPFIMLLGSRLPYCSCPEMIFPAKRDSTMCNPRSFWFSTGCILMIAASSASAVETVRVDASLGVPRIVVDGKPVRARMFWGGMGPGLIHVEKAEQMITFEFLAAQEDAWFRCQEHALL